ncbi:helix-turn-helix domain-containing protein [Lactobacillus delbrueckii]|uniref:helix-turn-helix domain-containing protein n=1 Tax=Lactobacillus delbrueckii TaxID=1584 RepID=UPI001E396ECD|nr:XRE family transcriptional regulator [Lactobacillus delbrueckii]MCD5446141.1 XRE family transcriptional regulator [Lactobacillus delbrueckii subsp. lactis]
MSIGTRIRSLRKSNKLTLEELANQLNSRNSSAGFTKGRLSKWENDREEPKLSSLNQVAQFFNVDIDYFFNESQPSNASSLPRNIARIPVIGTIACGDPIDADENIVDYINVPEPIPTGAFALVCEGSSMEPSIVDGDKVVIEPTPDVEDGQVAAVLVDDQTKATLKRIKHIGNSIWLMPDNRDYDPIVLDAQHPGRIIGKAIKLIRDRI